MLLLSAHRYARPFEPSAFLALSSSPTSKCVASNLTLCSLSLPSTAESYSDHGHMPCKLEIGNSFFHERKDAELASRRLLLLSICDVLTALLSLL